MPYIRHYVPVKFSLHMRPTPDDYVDVFDPDFKQICDNAAEEQVAPFVNDTLLIGFTMADIPGLTEMWAKVVNIPTWAMVLRNLPGSAPGKQVYVETMQEQYDTITEFNAVYETEFNSWDELRNAEDWRPETDFNNADEVKDNNVFNKKCMAKYYETASASFRAVDQNHLFFGDKLNVNLQDPNELDIVVDVAKDYVDAVCIQFYGREGYQTFIQNKIVKASGNIPFFNGDGGFGAYGDPKMPNPQTPTAKNQAQRAVWFSEHAEEAFSNPNYIGWHICGVIDAWNPEGTQKAGIMNPLGEFHSDVIDTLRSISRKLYKYKPLISSGMGANFPESEKTIDSPILIGNFPNPFNNDTQIVINLQEKARVVVDIHNAKGKLIERLNDSIMDAGANKIHWTKSDVATGIYVLNIQHNNKVHTHKILCLK